MLRDILILVCDQSKCINICKRLQKRIQLAKALYKFLDFINRKYFTLILKFKIFNQRCTGKFCYRYGHFQNTEAVTGSVRKSFTKITGKHLCQCLFFNKVAVMKLQGSLKTLGNLIKKETHWCFRVNFVKFLRAPFLQVTVSQNMKAFI